MRTSILACVAVLAATGCTSRSPAGDQSRAGDPHARAAVQGETTILPDTAFIEIRRFTRYGFRTPQGGCVTSSQFDSRERPPGINRVEERVLSSNPKLCMYEVALGYRKVWPEPDTTGYSSISVSVDLDSAAIAALRRHR